MEVDVPLEILSMCTLPGDFISSEGLLDAQTKYIWSVGKKWALGFRLPRGTSDLRSAVSKGGTEKVPLTKSYFGYWASFCRLVITFIACKINE